MNVEWDPDKARRNREKHGVAFADAELALYDPNGLTREDERVEGEERYVTIGLDALGRILVVVYTYRGDSVRLISARQATRREARDYEG